MEIIQAVNAPAAIGPYSHAVRSGKLIFCSGQTPLDPDTMDLVGEDIQSQTIQVLENIRMVLNGCGLELSSVVKTTVFLTSMQDFEGMNEVYAKAFGTHRPARTTVAVRENPRNALVEIECIAEAA